MRFKGAGIAWTKNWQLQGSHQTVHDHLDLVARRLPAHSSSLRSACIYGDDAIVHYGPGDRPLCGNDAVTAVYTDDPARVAGCADCLELVAEDVQDHNDYRGHCLHCRPRRGGMAPGGPEALPALRTARVVERQPHLCFEGRRLGLLLGR